MTRRGFFYLLMFTYFLAPAQKRLYYAYRIENKWGFSDVNGKILITPEYDAVSPFFTHYFAELYCAKVYKKNKEAYIDTNNSKITKYFDKINFSFSENKFNYLIKKRGKYGVTDRNYKIIIPFDYDSLFQDEMDLYSDLKDKYYGKKNLKWYRIIIKDSLNITEIKDLSSVTNAQSEYYFYEGDFNDIQNENISENYFYKYEKLMKAKIDSVGRKFFMYYPYYIIYKDGKVGITLKDHIKNGEAKLLVTPEYDSILRIESFNGKGYFVVKKNEHVGMINEINEIVIPFKYANITDSFAGTFVTYDNGKYGIIDLINNFEIAPKYNSIKPNSEFKKIILYNVFDYGYRDCINTNGIEYFKNQKK